MPRLNRSARANPAKVPKLGTAEALWVKGEIPCFANLSNCDNITNSPANVNRFLGPERQLHRLCSLAAKEPSLEVEWKGAILLARPSSAINTSVIGAKEK